MLFSWRKRFGIALAHCFELYDIAVFAAISIYVQKNFFPESYFGSNSMFMVFTVFALRFLARPIGGLVIGMYADQYGRKQALIMTSAITGVATIIMACLPTFSDIGVLAPILFFIMQLLQSFAFGGENPTSVIYVMEHVKDNERSRTGAILWGTSLFAVAASTIIIAISQSFLAEQQMYEFGWRIPLFVGIVNLMFSFWFRVKLLESSSFKKSKKVGIDWVSATKIFLITAPSCLIFYINSVLSSALLKNVVIDPALQKILPICLNIVFFMTSLLAGYITDKYFDTHRALKKSYLFMIVFGMPIYALQDLGSPIALLVSEAFIAVFIGICLSSGPAVMASHVNKNHQVTSFALGMNLSAAIFAGCAPYMLHFLSQFGQVYIGLLMSFGGICFYLALAIDKAFCAQNASQYSSVK